MRNLNNFLPKEHMLLSRLQSVSRRVSSVIYERARHLFSHLAANSARTPADKIDSLQVGHEREHKCLPTDACSSASDTLIAQRESFSWSDATLEVEIFIGGEIETEGNGARKEGRRWRRQTNEVFSTGNEQGHPSIHPQHLLGCPIGYSVAAYHPR